MGEIKVKRVALILGLGCVIAIAITTVTHWSLSKNRYVTNAELQEQEREAYLEANAEYLERLTGPVRKLSAVDSIYREAAEAVSEELARLGENPEDYRARVYEENDATIFRFSVLHVDGFGLDTSDRLGNRSGKDRWIQYDVRLARVIHNRLQQ